MGKAKEFHKTFTSASMTYAKSFVYVDHNKVWKIFNEIGVPDHLTCLLRYLYAGQEVTEPGREQLTGSHWERSMLGLYIVTLLVKLLYRIHHVKCQAC